MKTLPREFFYRDVDTVARELLGCILVRTVKDGRRLAGRIVETEAYAGSGDPASHSRNGKTARNAVMFGPGGHLYVYFTYGMHFCCNIVTGPEEKGEAVLLRAVEPLEGIELMALRRYGRQDIGRQELLMLCRGPARLCRAFGIGPSENGTDLLHGEFFLNCERKAEENEIIYSPRIGIREGREQLRRYYYANNPWVSRGPSGKKNG